MDQRDQAAMAEAQAKGDQAKMDAIRAKYDTSNNDSTSSSGNKTATSTSGSGNGTVNGNTGIDSNGGKGSEGNKSESHPDMSGYYSGESKIPEREADKLYKGRTSALSSQEQAEMAELDKKRHDKENLIKHDKFPTKIPEMKDYLKDENKTKKFLEEIIQSPEDYAFAAYERTAITKGKRGPIRTHSLYVITKVSTKQKATLSFNGNQMWFKSEGAWVLNSETDVESYVDFKSGKKNSYDMQLLYSPAVIDVSHTANNIINSINSSNKYFLIDHILDVEKHENCNTALYNTISLESSYSHKSGKF